MIPPGSSRILALGSLLALSCAPKFKPTGGGLTVHGALVQVDQCHVLAPDQGGVELGSASGIRIQLSMLPARLDAQKEMGGPVDVQVLVPPATDFQELGKCGSMTLRGEGYHSEGRRAMSGTASLSCGTEAIGGLSFSGCF